MGISSLEELTVTISVYTVLVRMAITMTSVLICLGSVTITIRACDLGFKLQGASR